MEALSIGVFLTDGVFYDYYFWSVIGYTLSYYIFCSICDNLCICV